METDAVIIIMEVMHLIKKSVKMPIVLEKLQALERRLPKNHEKYPLIKSDLKDRLSGYYGERDLFYYLSFFSNNDNFIYHDLRLPTSDCKHFQMDGLIVCSTFVVILETKHLSGDIFCDSTYNQLIHTYENRKKRYKDPLAQVKRQRHHLIKFLEWFHFPSVPIEYFVVFTNESCILTTDNKAHPFAQRFLHAENLIEKLFHLTSKYQTPILNLNKMENLNKLLLENNTPKDYDILKNYKISPKELQCGVICPKCHALPMIRVSGKWFCPSCHFSSKTAHEQAVTDYFLLIKPSITNKECREFLCLDSRDHAKRILLSMNLSVKGNKKVRVYLKA